jgi:hypothetical protein
MVSEMPLPIVKQINDLAWYLQRRRERRWLNRKVERWERTRALGRARFVWRYVLGWGLSMSLFLIGWHYFTNGYFSSFVTLLMIPLGVALGWWTASAEWAARERLYERSRHEGIAESTRGERQRSRSSEA